MKINGYDINYLARQLEKGVDKEKIVYAFKQDCISEEEVFDLSQLNEAIEKIEQGRV